MILLANNQKLSLVQTMAVLLYRIYSILLLFASFTQSWGFIWPIDSVYDYGKGKFTFSELYMYSGADAPFGYVVKRPSIHLEVDVSFAVPTWVNTTVALAIFHVDDNVVHDPIDISEISSALTDLATGAELCSNSLSSSYTNHEFMKEFPTNQVELSNLGKNGFITPHYEFHSRFKSSYDIHLSGLYSIIVEVCDTNQKEGIVDGTVKVKGDIRFVNPYGYLSGIYYGYLPFEGTRACTFAVFALLYMGLLVLHRNRLLITHWCILIVVVLCAIESCTWFAAYAVMNETGQPYCCPFPTGIAVAMFLQVFRRTLSRSLLLSICLGFGLARLSLNKQELCALTLLSALYLGASLAVNMHDVIEINDLHHDSEHSIWWDVPVLILDMFFLMWIYLALLDTMGDLRAAGQTMKLKLYSKLGYVMGVFVGLVTLITMIMIMARSGVFAWPWRLYWAQTVLWEVLNLAVLVAVSVIWAPSERAQLLAHSFQLTTDEYTEEFNDVEDHEVMSQFDHDDEERSSPRSPRSPSPRSKEFEKQNISAFSDYDEEDTNDFSIDACVIADQGIEMSSPANGTHIQERSDRECEDEEDYNVLPTVAG